METVSKLKLLTSQMEFESAEDYECPKLSGRKKDAVVFTHASLPDGTSIKLLKTLLTSVCERNCYYCPFRSGRDFQRATFSPQNFADLFMYLYQKRIVDGIFLSSGIIRSGVFTQDQIIKTAEILRNKHKYRGYLHLKIMPGCDFGQVERAMQLADRLSVNLESPNPERLRYLAPRKHFYEELMQPLNWINEIREQQSSHTAWNGRWPSSVTQFVVGAVGETDLELLNTTEHLYKTLNLGRVYYSRFNPVIDTPLENVPHTPIERESRLYQASFLLRDYKFSIEELPFTEYGNLPLDKDPKLAWAEMNLVNQPIEINKAEYTQLLRIPGIGPKSAKSIIQNRKFHPVIYLADLKKLGINQQRAAPYILLNGKRPSVQYPLF
jgi:predicted DNA-binding helix-hairpin-helix protein